MSAMCPRCGHGSHTHWPSDAPTTACSICWRDGIHSMAGGRYGICDSTAEVVEETGS